MAQFAVVVDTRALERRLTALEREQLPFARSLAANQAAFETRQTVQRAMPLFLDNPTPYVVRSVLVQRGDKRRPAADVYINDFAGKGVPPNKILRPVVRGVRRGQRPSERLLSRAGFITGGEGWVPAAVRRNRYGNVSQGQIVQILSGLRAFGEVGFQANLTGRSRAAGRRRGRSEYFVARGSDHLRRGVWERYGPGRRRIRPVLLFIDLPVYPRRFDFTRIAGDEARRRYVAAFPAALRRALRTARR